jgi:putative tryptophan/tyrosine transport system substrate-binding protein
MRRRDFIAAMLGGAAAWPVSAPAQQKAMPVIGFLNGASPQGYALYVESFRQGLKDAGYIEGENVTIEYRWAEGDYRRLPALADDLVRLQVAVIVANTQAARAAKAATTSIPIVFLTAFDPVRTGLVASLARPGGNVTGLSIYSSALAARHLGLLREFKPAITSIAVLANPDNPGTAPYLDEAEATAQTLGQQLRILNASTPAEVDAAFARLPQLGAGALIIVPDAFLLDRRDQLVALAARHPIPALFTAADFVAAGGLMSYGANLADQYRQAGIYAGKILKGANPAELPVLQPTKFELRINLKTATALGIEIPATLMAIADEVIE